MGGLNNILCAIWDDCKPQFSGGGGGGGGWNPGTEWLPIAKQPCGAGAVNGKI